jgi:hypothetical protein
MSCFCSSSVQAPWLAKVCFDQVKGCAVCDLGISNQLSQSLVCCRVATSLSKQWQATRESDVWSTGLVPGCRPRRAQW